MDIPHQALPTAELVPCEAAEPSSPVIVTMVCSFNDSVLFTWFVSWATLQASALRFQVKQTKTGTMKHTWLSNLSPLYQPTHCYSFFNGLDDRQIARKHLKIGLPIMLQAIQRLSKPAIPPTNASQYICTYLHKRSSFDGSHMKPTVLAGRLM